MVLLELELYLLGRHHRLICHLADSRSLWCELNMSGSLLDSGRMLNFFCLFQWSHCDCVLLYNRLLTLIALFRSFCRLDAVKHGDFTTWTRLLFLNEHSEILARILIRLAS